MKSTYILFSLFLLSFLFISSCSDKDMSIDPKPYELDINSSSLNSQSRLGRVLFYDAHLSLNNSISCATCHKQSFGFSDNVAQSRGFENIETSRNSPPIQNMNLINSLFWDGRESDITSMVLKPIFNHVEMGMTDADAMVQRLQNLPYYADLFNEAFGSQQVTIQKVAQALSSFISNFRSTSTRFDSERLGLITFSSMETEGKELFFTKFNCNKCHQVTVPNGYEHPPASDGGGDGFLNIGLDVNYADNGRADFTGNSEDIGKFKTPSLRNVSLTAPYMHDGRFTTLEEVIDHYSHGIQDHPNLDLRLRDSEGNALHMNITASEKQALIAFLNTLTDFSMVTNDNFSSPFH
jgi:cytochrome c peroxidase